jgi:hypothetical protein
MQLNLRFVASTTDRLEYDFAGQRVLSIDVGVGTDKR